MDVTFASRGEGWRGRGRPPRPVHPDIMAMLRRTYDTGQQAVLDITGHPPAEVDNVEAILRRGAKNLGLHLRCQRTATTLRFFVEDK